MRLIDADNLKHTWLYSADHTRPFVDFIDNAPTIEAEPVVHGHWIETQNRNFETGKWIPTFVCSHCKRIIMLKEKENLKDFPYCHCGAKMDEEV